ncbi:hypothetical protein SOH20_30185 [Bacillus thuringiensis]|uniref:Uncharacterized protein n=1 Tax=Bacillus thuringiensis TaxID=1428 RepID=A0AAW9GR15_BACTU|nr:hypothetical protein [Bacillus thuringiensis]MDY0855081.1 hypothetical protein [Bacillus thuringiensis]
MAKKYKNCRLAPKRRNRCRTPSGERYPSKEINVYTHSLEHAIQIIDNEIQRRLGSGYHCHISCIHTDEHSDYQLALF